MSFPVRLFAGLMSSLPHRYGRENWDEERFGPPRRRGVRAGLRWLLFILKHARGFGATYALLDDDSRHLMLQLLLYRVFGYRRLKLPTNTSDYWEKRRTATDMAVASDDSSGRFRLALFDLSQIGYPIKLYAIPIGVATTFMLRHYEHRLGDRVVGVQAGDYVIDAGGCWGDTALYFAHEAGPDGKVFSFEFVDDNIEIFNRNLAMNPDLEKRVEIVPHPVFSRSDVPVYYHAKGPSTRVGDHRVSASDTEVMTLSIDDFVERHAIPRLDFIKMDVEGAELDALKGAENSIRRFRPRLAISLYHKRDDFVVIPAWLQGLGVGYSFHLGHYTVHSEETVLFALPSADGAQ